jgi:SAM-dependent methyltransferase
MPDRPKSVAQERFGAFAQSYATSLPHAKGESLARLVECVAHQSGFLALDIATGAGHVALALARRVSHVVALDLTPQMLRVTRTLAGERRLGNLSLVEARAEALPFAEGGFDLVTCRIAPHHFDDVGIFVEEASRVLRPGGLFGLVDNVSPDSSMMGYDAPTLTAAAQEYNAMERLRDPSHRRCLTLGEWRALIAQAGLLERHVELLEKTIVLGPWADQQAAGDAVKRQLQSMLLAGSAAFRAFLRPTPHNGDVDFILTEAVLVAAK